jgi:hypothetical protein
MTTLEWQTSSDPQVMLRWLSRQGYMDALWLFTIASTRRFLGDSPMPKFIKVVDLAEQAGHGQASWKMVDEALLAQVRDFGHKSRDFGRLSERKSFGGKARFAERRCSEDLLR